MTTGSTAIAARHCVDGLPGCVVRQVDTTTGATIAVYEVAQAALGGLAATMQSPWVTMCEQHFRHAGHASEAAARADLGRARTWCSGCRAIPRGE